MKNYALFALSITMTFAACNKDKSSPEPIVQNSATPSSGTPGGMFRYSGTDYSQAISIQQANTMIQSYLTSIRYPDSQNELRSLTFDADTLRAYLDDTTHGKIVTIKFMLAHQPAYAQNSYGLPAGLKANALTMVMVGLDENDDYIYNKDNKVYDHFRPCPTYCDNTSAILTTN